MGVGTVLALAAAVGYGTTHFVSGLLSRRATGVAVAMFAQAGGTLLTVALALSLRLGAPTLPALGWGALSGVGAGLGMAFFYRGLARGPMSVVAPVSDLAAVGLPVLVGIAVLGERVSFLALGGVAAAIPAIWLVSRGHAPEVTRPAPARQTGLAAGPGTMRRPRIAAGVGDGLLGGAGVALAWVSLAQIPTGTGLWPFVASRAVSVAAIVPLVLATRTSLRLPARTTAPAAAVGTVGTTAALCYMLATRTQLLALTTVLSALYPAITVLLALVVLRERLSTKQSVGLACAAAAASLIALGGGH